MNKKYIYTIIILSSILTQVLLLRIFYSLFYYDCWLSLMTMNPYNLFITAEHYYEKQNHIRYMWNDHIIIIRHDLDNDYDIPRGILSIRVRDMTTIELKHNVKSSYYFREKDLFIYTDLILFLREYNFEVGLHYENQTMERLNQLIDFFNFKTISCHSNNTILRVLPNGIIGDVSSEHYTYIDQYTALLPSCKDLVNFILIHPERWRII